MSTSVCRKVSLLLLLNVACFEGKRVRTTLKTNGALAAAYKSTRGLKEQVSEISNESITLEQDANSSVLHLFATSDAAKKDGQQLADKSVPDVAMSLAEIHEVEAARAARAASEALAADLTNKTFLSAVKIDGGTHEKKDHDKELSDKIDHAVSEHTGKDDIDHAVKEYVDHQLHEHDLEESLTVPDDMQTAMVTASSVYCLIVFIFCTWFVFTDGAMAHKVQEVAKKRDEVNRLYDGAAVQLSSQLNNISRSNAIFAEMSFQSHSRIFVNFLEYVNRDFVRSANNDQEHAAKLRGFLNGWLTAFEECSLDPQAKPRVVLRAEEIKIRNTEQLVQLLIQRTVANPISFLSDVKQMQEHIKAVGIEREKEDEKKAGQRKKRTVQALSKKKRNGCCCGCCGLWWIFSTCCGCFWSFQSWLQCTCKLKCTTRSKTSKDKTKSGPLYEAHVCCLIVKILSTSHMWLILLCLSGMWLLTFIGMEIVPIMIEEPRELTFHELVSIGCALFGWWYTLWNLRLVSAIDEHARLRAEVEKVEAEKMKVEKERNQINKKFEVVDELASLWHQRTIPILDLYREVGNQFKDTKPELRGKFLEQVWPKIKHLVEGMGDLSMWHGPKKIADRKLSPVAEQLKVIILSVSKSYQMPDPIKYSADRIKLPGFLFVRVLGCDNLMNKGAGILGHGMSSPYVLVSVGNDGVRSFRTPTCKDTLSPRWATPHEDGGVDEEEDTNMFPLLPDESECTLEVWDDFSRNSMGFVTVYFREFSPGFWHKKRERLWSMRSQSRGHGEIEYEIYFCTSVRLLKSEWSRSKQARASRNFRLSFFLGDGGESQSSMSFHSRGP